MAIQCLQRIAVFTSLGVLLVGQALAEADSRITVLVYDYAGLPTDTLLGAEQESRRIFLHSEVDVNWRHCRMPVSPTPLECPDHPSPMTPALRLVTRFQPVPNRVHADAMGYSTGDYATVSVEFAQQLEKSGAGQLPAILGHAIAHEIGHLLLPGNPHSVSGIMRAQWSRAEWTLLRQGNLNFTPEQARFLQAELLRRLPPIAKQTR